MSYTSRYSSSYSSRYTDSGRDPSSRYGGYSSRYSTGKDLTGSDEYSSPRESKYASSYRTKTYDTSEDVDVDKKLAEDEVDSSKGYSSSRYGKYSSRYTSATDETGSDDYTGKRESKYSSSYRSKYRDTSDDVDLTATKKNIVDDYEHDYTEKSTEKSEAKKELKQEEEDEGEEQELEYQEDTNLQLATEDVEQYAGDEEDTAIQEGDEGEEAEEGEEETIRSHTSSMSSSALAAAAGAHAEQIEEEKPKRQIEQKVSFRPPSTDNSEPRVAKHPIENIVPKKKVSDLIAKFNTGNVTNGRAEAWKDREGSRPVGKLQSSVFH